MTKQAKIGKTIAIHRDSKSYDPDYYGIITWMDKFDIEVVVISCSKHNVHKYTLDDGTLYDAWPIDHDGFYILD